MGYSKKRTKEEYNRKEVFVKHEDVDLLTMVAEVDATNLTEYLHDVIAKECKRLRGLEDYIKRIKRQHGKRIRKATKSR